MRSTYTFKKGYSRSSTSSNSDSETPPPKLKRAKTDIEERKKEVDNLTSLIENVKSHLQIKQKRLEKAKSVKDFKQCDQLTLEIRTLLKEKGDHEKQLTAIQKKEAKSLWHHKTKSSKKEKKPKTEKVVNKPLKKFLFKDTSAAKVVTSSNETTSTVKIPLDLQQVHHPKLQYLQLKLLRIHVPPQKPHLNFLHSQMLHCHRLIH